MESRKGTTLPTYEEFFRTGTFDGEIVVEDPYYPIAFLENPSLEAEIAMQRNANVSRLGDTPQESAMAAIAELYAYAVDLCLIHQPNPNQD